MNYIIEIATSDFSTTKAAVEGGADRVELCANLGEGGTTASYGTILQCRRSFAVQLYPIIRPRGGDFLYSGNEFDIMRRDINICKQSGCDGIVTGLLNSDGSIDVKRTATLVDEAYPMEVTFHRAFDRCHDPFEALEQLIGIGCTRLLTSGQKKTALDGVELIAELNRVADHRIVIMPGSGVRADNIRVLAEKTGCTEFHSSLRRTEESTMTFAHPSFDKADYMNNSIDPEEVLMLKNLLSQSA